VNPVILGVALLTLSAVAITAIWVYANRCVFGSRGEVADVPPIPKSPDEFPAKRPCVLNADPHWCADTSSDDEVIAAMEAQFPKPQTRRIR